MRILISGAHGFIGSALSPFLQERGHTVIRLARQGSAARDIIWNPESGQLDTSAIDGFDAVVHLAGANIAGKRWTQSVKREIWNSRIAGTQLLVARLGEIARPPSVFICSSATGYYGNRGDETLTEESAPGTGFLADLCIAWEDAPRSLAARRTRVVNLRTGMVLSAHGGALKKMLWPFKLGIGGRLGSGDQYWSWIALIDYLAAVEFILSHENLRGPVNMVAPQPVTNREFTLALAQSLRRPAIFPVPAVVLRAVFGEMADSLFFSSQRTLPSKLIANGFVFANSRLVDTFSSLVGAPI